jgi:hypothetical protein
MEIEKLLTPAIVAAIVSAIVGPLVFFFLKRWDDKNRRTFDIRFNEYKHYLKALEQISSSTHVEFERFLSETYAEHFAKILSTEGDATQILIELNMKLNELTSGIRKAFEQATQELNGLRLVCSATLLEMVNEFISIQRQLLDESVSLMGRVKEISLHNPSSILSGEMKLKGEQASSLFEKIVVQMRSELKIK